MRILFIHSIQPKSEVLLVASTAGIFEAIYLENYQALKKVVKGPSFTLDLRVDHGDPESNILMNSSIILSIYS